MIQKYCIWKFRRDTVSIIHKTYVRHRRIFAVFTKYIFINSDLCGSYDAFFICSLNAVSVLEQDAYKPMELIEFILPSEVSHYLLIILTRYVKKNI